MDLKSLAAQEAIKYIGDARVLGLGTGSTAEKFLDLLGERVASGELGGVVGIPTSTRTEEYARALNIPLGNIDEVPSIEITIDGADEVDPRLDLIKGHGGALTREKIVASASDQLIIIVDESKRVEKLGSSCALPVEVLKFGWTQVKMRIEKLGAQVELRMNGSEPFISDQGNFIIDCQFDGGISDPDILKFELKNLTGVVDHGLFLEMTTRVIVATNNGVEILEQRIR